MTFIRPILLSFLSGLLISIAYADVRLPVIFQHHMVLQRDKDIVIWGFAGAGEKVSVNFNLRSFETTAGKDGKWKVALPAQPAGGPYTLTVKGKNTVTLNDILLGDVWICGGQSNMQYTIGQIQYTEKDTARASNPKLRLFTGYIDMDYVAKDDLKGGAWSVASVASINNFSAVAYFFGRDVQEETGVPIGLVSINLGATPVECWMSPEALSRFPQFQEYHKTFLAPAKNFAQVTAAFEKQKASWQKKNRFLDDPGLKEAWYNPSTDISDWKTMELPTWWELSGLPEYDGSVWFRREFDLPEGFKGDTYNLSLTQIDDYDMVWINGEKVGESYGHLNWRNYPVPARLLKAKKNTLVIRVFDAGGYGGLYTGSIWWNPALAGKWFYKPGVKIDASTFTRPHVVNISPFSSPALLFNANIAPVKDLGLKGVIWYQGEANISRAQEYRQLFPAMIRDWRKLFNQGDLPFVFVQLANHLNEASQSGESDWAELREAQAAALSLPSTGMATAIDIGDTYDLHPRNKWDVGKRLALEALRVAYQKQIISSGPAYRSIEVNGNTVIVHFKHTGGGLISKDKYGFIRGFSIAGEDKKFHWAKAFIQGETIVVQADSVSAPVAVRYAWADNPGPLDLYNKEGLPAVPFRTDNWTMKTSGKTYTGNPWDF